MRQVATFQREIHKSFNKMFSEIARNIAERSEGLRDLAKLREAIDKDTLEELDKEITKIEQNALKIEKIYSEIEKIAGEGVAVGLKQKIKGPIGALLRFFVTIEGLGRFGRATTKEDESAWNKIAPETGPLKWPKMTWGVEGKVVIKKGGSIRVGDLKLIPYILKFLWQPKKGSVKEIMKLLVDLKGAIDTVKAIIEFLNLEMEATLKLIGELNGEVVEETTLFQTRKSLLSALTKGDNINEAITKYIIDTLVQKKQSGMAVQEYSPEEIKLIAESVGQKIAELMSKAKGSVKDLVRKIIEIIKEKYEKVLGIGHKVELLKAKTERIHRHIHNVYDTIIFEITPIIHEIARLVEETIDKAIEEAEKDMEHSK
jgi:gas vesicle protein